MKQYTVREIRWCGTPPELNMTQRESPDMQSDRLKVVQKFFRTPSHYGKP